MTHVLPTPEETELKTETSSSVLPIALPTSADNEKEEEVKAVPFIVSVSTGAFNSTVQHYLIDDMRPSVGDAVMVENQKRDGEICGRIATARRPLYNEDPSRLRRVLRLATPEEVRAHEELHKKTQHILSTAKGAVKRLKLPLHIGYAEYKKKENKALLFFTSDQRVDYRELVKELGWELNMKIDMLQAGARELAKYVGGCGVCGQTLCCSTFLNSFAPISVKMAKVQDLSLNPGKISGCCGRLMCCLEYEFEAYRGLKKSFPKQGARFKCDRGNCQVTKNDLFGGKIIIYETDNQRLSEMTKEEYLPFFKEGKNHMLPLEQAEAPNRQRREQQKEAASKEKQNDKREARQRPPRPKLQKMYKSIDDLDIASGDGMLYKSSIPLGEEADRKESKTEEGDSRDNRQDNRNNRPPRSRSYKSSEESNKEALSGEQPGGSSVKTEGEQPRKRRRKRRRRQRGGGSNNAPRSDGGQNSPKDGGGSTPPPSASPKE